MTQEPAPIDSTQMQPTFESEQMAEQLWASERRYRRIFEAARDGMIILDGDTRKIVDVNPFLMELLAYSRQDFLGKELWEIGLLEDAAASAAALRELQEVGYICHDHLPLKRKDGRIIPVEFVGNLYIENDHQIVHCNIRDITRRKLAEAESARLAAVVEFSDDGIISKTLEGIITTWNAGAQKLYGYSAEEAIGRHVTFLAPLDLPDEMPALLGRIAAGFTVEHYETVRVAKDGSRVDISLSISPLKDAQGHIVGASSIKRDITQRKRAEETLLRNVEEQRHLAQQLTAERSRLLTAQKVAKIGSWETDVATMTVIWSDETHRIYETDPLTFTATHQKFLEFVHPEDRVRVKEAFLESLGQRAPCQLEHRLLLLNGEVKEVDERWQLSFNEQGDPVRAIGTCQDITERKNAEAKSKFQKALLEAQTEASLDGILFVSDQPEERKILSYNRRLVEMWNIPPEVVASGDDAALRDAILSQVVNRQEITEEADAIYQHPLEKTRDELAIRNGRIFDRYSTPIADSNGKYYGRVWYFRDVTEHKQAEAALLQMGHELELRVQRRTAELERANLSLLEKEAEQRENMHTLAQSEERFRLLVESVHDYAILMLDTNGNIITWNAGAEHLKGYRAEEIIGQHFSCFYTPEEQESGKPEQELKIAAIEGFYDDEGWRVRRDNSRFWATVVITALRDGAGNLRGFVKVTRDITERKNIEAVLREAKDQADAANQAKSEFLSRMSHELRTPLNAILGFGQLLAKQDFPAPQLERVQYILKAGRHLLNLINEVLEIG